MDCRREGVAPRRRRRRRRRRRLLFLPPPHTPHPTRHALPLTTLSHLHLVSRNCFPQNTHSQSPRHGPLRPPPRRRCPGRPRHRRRGRGRGGATGEAGDGGAPPRARPAHFPVRASFGSLSFLFGGGGGAGWMVTTVCMSLCGFSFISWVAMSPPPRPLVSRFYQKKDVCIHPPPQTNNTTTQRGGQDPPRAPAAQIGRPGPDGRAAGGDGGGAMGIDGD